MIGRRRTPLRIDGAVAIAPTATVEARPMPSHCIAAATGSIAIGPRTRIGPGAAISSSASVEIGADVTIGAYVVVMDDDFHLAGRMAAQAEPRPIRIEDRVVIGHAVTVLPGSSIGAGAVVRSGSVVGGRIEAGATVSGHPARPAGEGIGRTADVFDLLHRVLGETVAIAPDARLADVDGLDSLAMLRLLIEIEDELGVRLDNETILDTETVGDLHQLVLATAADAGNEVAGSAAKRVGYRS